MNVLRHLINPLVSWLVTHDELEVLAPDVVRSLVMDVFQNPEKGVGLRQDEKWVPLCPGST